MKGKLVSMAALFSVLILFTTGVLYFTEKQTEIQDTAAEQIVAVNEIEQLAKSGEYEKMSEKAALLQLNLRSMQPSPDNGKRLFILCSICILFIIVIFGYIYISILRPFKKLKCFAQEIALGNFNVPLDYTRSNYFGAFTWAFDSMRREITKARSCEREAVENNKTVIATLSHDIKTPVSSIRAYAEGLEANMDVTPEKRRKYLSVIMKKCDEVSRLTNDLFLHSLSDLDKLEIIPEKFELGSFLETIVSGEISAAQNDVYFQNPSFTVMVSADKNRLVQIVENLINNARKYAKSEINIFLTLSDGNVEIHFRDYGAGIPDKDMPFIFDKFFRGGNCKNEQGSGLGLYIVKYIAEQMHGSILLHNHSNGLEAVIALPALKIE